MLRAIKTTVCPLCSAPPLLLCVSPPPLLLCVHDSAAGEYMPMLSFSGNRNNARGAL